MYDEKYKINLPKDSEVVKEEILYTPRTKIKYVYFTVNKGFLQCRSGEILKWVIRIE